jgi:nicotinamidase-related amidase
MPIVTGQSAHADSKLSIASETILLLADLQAGIADLPLTVSQDLLKRNVAALLKLAAIFDIPMVVTVVPGADGKPSKLMTEVEAAMTGTIFVRTTPNSMNDSAIRSAIEGSRRKVLVISGVATEVAVQLPALTAAAEGYDVHVIVDACGGVSQRTEEAAMRRLAQGGVKTSSLLSLIGELAGDFSEARGQQAIGVLFDLAST